MAENQASESHDQENQEEIPSSEVVVVMVPLPAQGHLNQLLHLSRLLSTYGLTVYYVAAATHIRQAQLRVQGWDPSSSSNITFQEYPSIPFHNPPPDPSSSLKFPSQIVPSLMASTRLRQPLNSFIEKLSRNFRRVVVIYDSLMSYVVQDIDSAPDAEAYCFRSVSAFAVHLMTWEFTEKSPDFHLPDHVAEILKDVPSTVGYLPPEFSEFVKMQHGAKKVSSGDIFNSSREIESVYLDLLSKGQMTGTENIWAIGPFHPFEILERRDSNSRHKCLNWLDKQVPNSVIYVSFGTTCSFPDEQIKEIAFGLERSGRKFLWVLREADKGDIFSGEVSRAEIPKGFEERVKERGIIVRDWAPQLEILGHFAIGGFMSHCGWNSCVESISMGVPVAAWPMHSDQPANAVLLTKVLRIGVEVRSWERRDELVSLDRVELAVRRLMDSDEGDEMRRRAVELGNAVKNSGMRRKEMDSFVTHLTR